MKNKTTLALLVLFLAATATSCTSTQTGALVGGGAGAGAGAIIGHQSGHSGEGALIGGALGAITGAIVGHEIDKDKQPTHTGSDVPQYYGQESHGGDYYEGDYNAEGRNWVPEHEEVRVYNAPDGSRYEKRILVPGHYE
jgi:hypothetical protein